MKGDKGMRAQRGYRGNRRGDGSQYSQATFMRLLHGTLKVAEHFKIDALFGILLPYTRIFISYNSTRLLVLSY